MLKKNLKLLELIHLQQCYEVQVHAGGNGTSGIFGGTNDALNGLAMHLLVLLLVVLLVTKLVLKTVKGLVRTQVLLSTQHW